MPIPTYRPVPKRRVRCPNCNRVQPDGGKRTTCESCGYQPIYSYAYARDNPFHPEYKGASK